MFLIALLVAFCAMGTANAAYVEHTDSVTLQPGNWLASLTIPKFNEAGYNLESIKFTLTGHIEGTAKFESLDASPSTVTMYLTADLKLQRPDASVLALATPLVSTVDQVTAHDGVIDWGGGSGRTHDGLSADVTASWTSTQPTDLALFTGAGDIVLQASSVGKSYGSGPGNIIQWFTTETSADVWVRYNYSEVPEPAGMLALLSGVGGLCGYIRLRRRQ